MSISYFISSQLRGSVLHRPFPASFYFRSFQTTFQNKTVDVSGTRTRIVGVEGKHADLHHSDCLGSLLTFQFQNEGNRCRKVITPQSNSKVLKFRVRIPSHCDMHPNTTSLKLNVSYVQVAIPWCSKKTLTHFS